MTSSPERAADRSLLGSLGEPRAVLLETLKRDGTLVGTPVFLVVDGDRAVFGTPAAAGKVKRMRNFSSVRITACTLRGRTFGPTLGCAARRLHGDEAAEAERLLRRRFPFTYRVLVPLELAVRRSEGAHVELRGFSEAPGEVGAA